ncbi:Phosphotransferase enzyme family protein [Humidesulfovibrio mexicanus]|uniref:Phosphotransferase enzyme family protein n=1 Tax=Humidesulfovibrio mexicanus TaxID=147047 RepID=A0A239D567_9BACT|nr:aminoglycoside phosphotransferase family protein [Humidesulfovibrio mexicanus]SNS27292.1 Phosphotransferase enzyme family protein [Humidesulfovibrio mexicanus]
MIDLTPERVAEYLRRAFGPGAELDDLGAIGTLDKQGIKRFGYGKPLLVRFRVDGEPREGVLSVMRGDKYGHQFYWDRAAILMFQFETSARLPRHVRPMALGYVDAHSRLVPVAEPCEFFIMNEKLRGYDYFLDLERISGGDYRPADRDMARALARWLAEIHAVKKDDADLYYRHVRNLLGASECIMGLVDEAFPHPCPFLADEDFARLEKRLIDWRWKLRGFSHRLSVVHGDVHPWNILVDPPDAPQRDFRVLDRSRGEWGEPASDLASLAANYLLFGLRMNPEAAQPGALFQGPFAELWNILFEEYLAASGDQGVLAAIAPFFVFRGLVIVSPEWYPDHPEAVRRALVRFILRVLEDEAFDWRTPGRYLEPCDGGQA